MSPPEMRRFLALISSACLSWGMVILDLGILVISLIFSQAVAAIISTIGCAVFYTIFQNTMKKIKETINAE
jgi:hypothetical protein